jgi:beta-aspartyl-peptidase (threonine type)
MIYNGETLEKASSAVIMEDLKSIGGLGGLIGIDREGNISMPFNTSGMFRGFKKPDGQEFVGIF